MMNKLNNLVSDSFAVMIPNDVHGDSGASICKLKQSAIRFLVTNKKINSNMDIQQFKCIQTVEQLEMFLQQYALSNDELLSIYRACFNIHG